MKYLQAQLSIAYATGVMAFESRGFMVQFSEMDCQSMIIWFEIKRLILRAKH
jgi:hypothetical protein